MKTGIYTNNVSNQSYDKLHIETLTKLYYLYLYFYCTVPKEIQSV